MKKLSLFLLLFPILLFSCNSSDESKVDSNGDKSPRREILRTNIGNEPPTLDWSRSTDSTSYTILINIMDGLTKFGDDFKPVPALAESWQISEDGKIYTFKLRPGVNWTDGKPLKSKDLEYS